MQYMPPKIEARRGAARLLRDLPGRVLVVTMDIPWAIVEDLAPWSPRHVHKVTDVERATLDRLNDTLPECDIVVGIGGGSCCDTAKFLAWKRGCRMVLVPTILSVDAPLTNQIAVRVENAVQYVGEIWPREIIVDYDLIQRAPKELNRAGACDIASIHTALYDWKLAHEHAGEPYDEAVAHLARECLAELDANAAEIYDVTPKGIDTIVDLFRREVEFCARVGTSRPEEGSEHIVAYGLEHLTRRHFIHGDLVALGIFAMSRLQENDPAYATDLVQRLGLRYTCPDAAPDEVRQCLLSLKAFKEQTRLFFSVVDTQDITPPFVEASLAVLYR